MDPWIRKIPWRRKWQFTPVFLPGKPHGQRNLAGYSPKGCKDSDMTKHTLQWAEPYREMPKQRPSSGKVNSRFKEILTKLTG